MDYLMDITTRFKTGRPLGKDSHCVTILANDFKYSRFFRTL